MVSYRTYSDGDYEAVREVFSKGLMDYSAGHEEEFARYIRHSLADDLADIPGHYLGEPGSHFWVAENDGAVVGIVGVQRRSDDEGELRRMSVAANARRQGVGLGLLQTVEDFCRESGYKRIRLTTVSPLTAAIAMYRRFGYRFTGEESYGSLLALHFLKDI